VICQAKDDGKYVLIKDPNKPVLRLYAVPPNTFEDEEEEEGEGEEGTQAALYISCSV
jgi:translation initiation factor 3 subunit D